MADQKLMMRWQVVSKQLNTEKVAGFVFVSPFILGFLFFIFVPMFVSLYYSLCDYTIIKAPQFIGLKNYIRMFTADPRFWTAFWVTIKYAFVSVPLRVAFALLVALLLKRSSKMIPFYRAMFYLPSILGSSVAVAVLWKRLFANNGLVNQFFGTNIKWLGDTRTAIWVLIILSIWQFGSSMLIFLASLKQIPKSLYEAAEVDGVSKFRQFLSITFPLLTTTVFFNFIMQFINGLLVFSQGQIITAGKPLDSTLFYVLYMYEQSFSYNRAGYAVAMGWFMIVVIGFFTCLLFKSKKYWVYEGGY
jgi:multiple sugar transport system permease protein